MALGSTLDFNGAGRAFHSPLSVLLHVTLYRQTYTDDRAATYLLRALSFSELQQNALLLDTYARLFSRHIATYFFFQLRSSKLYY